MFRKVSAYEYYCQLEEKVEMWKEIYDKERDFLENIAIRDYAMLASEYIKKYPQKRFRWFRVSSFEEYCFSRNYYIYGNMAYGVLADVIEDNSEKYERELMRISCFDEYFYVKA